MSARIDRRQAIAAGLGAAILPAGLPVQATAAPSMTSSTDGEWRMRDVQMPTRWASTVSPRNVHPDYPRPQLRRKEWINLNGLWDLAFGKDEQEPPTGYTDRILVPYPVESALSGVGRPLGRDEVLWYRRAVDLAPGSGARWRLNFGAVDCDASIYINGELAGRNVGGYHAFSIDITAFTRQGANEIIVKVMDQTQFGRSPRGKQANPYRACSGIWKTVWLEEVPEVSIQDIRMTPDVDGSALDLQVMVDGPQEGCSFEVVVRDAARVVSRERFGAGSIRLALDRPRLWSPDDPFLYDITVTIRRADEVLDEVDSYFGMRKIAIGKDASGMDRIFLNNRYTYNLGVLLNAVWPESIQTPPTDEALVFDILAVKAMGFNTIRQHLKVECDRWYYHCDRLGILVWQDMVQPANATVEAHVEFERDAERTIRQVHNHPSVIMWILFNESWGVYDIERLSAHLRSLDPSRLLSTNSGPFRQDGIYRTTRDMGHDLIQETFRDRERQNEVVIANTDHRLRNWVNSDIVDRHNYPEPLIDRKSVV